MIKLFNSTDLGLMWKDRLSTPFIELGNGLPSTVAWIYPSDRLIEGSKFKILNDSLLEVI